MKNAASWTPSKFVMLGDVLRANLDANYVATSSRLNADLLAAALQTVLTRFAHGSLLDLGCGSVPLYGFYQALAKQVTCVDWDNSTHNLRHVDLTADLNLPLALPSASFDTVVLTDVLEHIAAPHVLLAEIRRVLRTDGMLLGTVPFMYRLHEEPHDYHRYTRHSLIAMARDSGLSVEFLEPYGQGTDVLFDVLAKILVNAHWRWGETWASWAHKLGFNMRSSKLGRHLNRNQLALPLGYVFALRASQPPSAKEM